jgi:hypothetical protein
MIEGGMHHDTVDPGTGSTQPGVVLIQMLKNFQESGVYHAHDVCLLGQVAVAGPVGIREIFLVKALFSHAVAA